MNQGPLGFRPIVRSLAMADSWAQRIGGASSRAVGRWPEAFLTIAEACAAGKAVGAETWQTALGMMDPLPTQDQAFVTLILATPILLINANPYGHRRLTIQDWGATLGFGPSTLAALDGYFQRLGQGQAIRPSSWENRPWEPSEQEFPKVADLWALVASLPGQWIAPLTLAQRWGWPATALALVGVWATIQAGPGGMPLQAIGHLIMDGQMMDSSIDHREPTLGPRWRGYGVTDLDALADALHQRWAGSPPAHR
ncbi:MAG: hypothetical protein ACHWZW_07605 [Spirulina sp.]